MVACTRRIAPASHGTKATSLGTARVDHAAWCMPSPHAPDVAIDHLAGGSTGSSVVDEHLHADLLGDAHVILRAFLCEVGVTRLDRVDDGLVLGERGLGTPGI